MSGASPLPSPLPTFISGDMTVPQQYESRILKRTGLAMAQLPSRRRCGRRRPGYVERPHKRSQPQQHRILASSPRGTALLTGDARGDHILQDLEAAGLLDDAGKVHVDVLKLQHHGSDRHVTKRFFQSVTADTYLISADGKNGNPDIARLRWLVDAAYEEGRRPRIVVTNETPSIEQLLVDRAPDQFGYSLQIRSPDDNAIIVDVGA